MKLRLLPLLVVGTVLTLGAGSLFAGSGAQAKILNYIRDHLRTGQPVRVTELYNTVFTTPQDHAALDKLYKDFFRIPMFVVRYQQQFSTPPSLKTIAEQFALDDPQEAETLLRVMETDPRVPKFITLDPKTGEITNLNMQMIRNDPRYAEGAVHKLGGWQGRPAPAFDLVTTNGRHLSTADLHGKVTLIYVWFTGCPPCMEEAPVLVRLQRRFGPKGFEVVGANADGMLGLNVSKEARRRYIEKEGISFPIVNWTREGDHAYGGVSIYPTLFLINRQGEIAGHWVGFTSQETLRKAIAKATAES